MWEMAKVMVILGPCVVVVNCHSDHVGTLTIVGVDNSNHIDTLGLHFSGMLDEAWRDGEKTA
jgi:hypothetical protein